MKIQILYEDKNVLVLNKPAGFLFDWVLAERPSLIPAHRLDKETSGAILFAKNETTYEFLKKQFQNREVKKTYLALVWGSVKNDKGIISASIGRSAKFGKFIASRGKKGKIREAVTEYKVLARTVLAKNSKDGPCYSVLEVSPKTGRTHQIRVHMKYINHPIVCDKLYAQNRPCPITFLSEGEGKGGVKLSRLALHAKSIEFKLPNNKPIKVEAPILKDLAKAISL